VINDRYTSSSVPRAFPYYTTAENLAAHRDDQNLPIWFNLNRGHDIFAVERREPRISMCDRKYVFDTNFEGREPANPISACPAGNAVPAPSVDAKAKSDLSSFEALLKQTPPKALAYQGGGMYPQFRALLKKFGQEKFAERVSDIKYPVSRPDAALADPFSK